jgi:integrase
MPNRRGKPNAAGPRSLPIVEWPQADQRAWEAACRPGHRFHQGGSASYLAEVSRVDIARRYGMFLDFLERTTVLDRRAPAAAQTTPENVAKYVEELQGRVRSVTVWNCVYKLRRASELMASAIDFGWLSEIEKDIAFTMQPRSKYDRLVLSERLLEAAMTLIIEAELSDCSPLERAKRVRNGAMIAFLSLCPIRAKNFSALELGKTFRKIADVWWITLPSRATKSRTPYERQVPSLIKPVIDKYIDRYRPALVRPGRPNDSLWLSSTKGRQMLASNISTLVSKITRETIGVSVSPHLFRTAGASTAAIYGGSTPNLASALLDHRDPRVTEDDYNRASSMSAAQVYASLVDALRKPHND